MKTLNHKLIKTMKQVALSTALLSTSSAIAQFDFSDEQILQANPLAAGIIIKYKNSTNKTNSTNEFMQQADNLSQKYGINLHYKRSMSGDLNVFSIDQDYAKNLSNQDLQEMVADLNKRADVEFAEIDAWMVPYFTPNDTAYNTQWHYFETKGGMNLPTAWDTTRGAGSVVAILDTGYRPHSDLAANVIGQYDMISSLAVAGDSDGRDADAQDPGDFVAAGQCGANSKARPSSWHGTHVAGTVAAVSNNNSTVAGVAGDAKLVPVRVLGRCGGSLSDIADGIRWAAGLHVAGVPANPNPADVINMSLGSNAPSACSQTYQSAITAAVNAGSTIVVASGNSNSLEGYSPANCAGVISVAATNRKGGRAFYSNYGSTIDIAAPGGDGCHPISDALPTSLTDCEGGVWQNENLIQSTHNTGTSTPALDNIGTLQGTSMAAPHVAGVVALMRSVNKNATPAQLKAALKSSARSFPIVNSHQCTSTNCGAGIVDASAAVAAIGNNTIPPNTNNQLSNGVAKTSLADALKGSKSFIFVVPTGATNLAFNLTGGTGDADLYVKFASAATTSSYDCRSWSESTNTEKCEISNVQAGTYHVLVYAYKAYSGASLTARFTDSNPNNAPKALFKSTCTDLTCAFNAKESSDSDGTIASYKWSFAKTGKVVSHTFASAGTHSVRLTVTDDDGAKSYISHDVVVSMPNAFETILVNGEIRSNLSATTAKTLNFSMDVPAGAQSLSFVMKGGIGDADMYVKFGGSPTFTDYDCRPYATGNDEICEITNIQAGIYTLKLYAYKGFSGVSLTGNFTAVGQPPMQTVFTNDTDINIPDNNPVGIASEIEIYRAGKAGRVKITYKINHSYIGDLTVKLIAPQGWVTLRNPSGGSADNIEASVVINANTSDAQGKWKLQVSDNAQDDTGYIDSWSVEFL